MAEVAADRLAGGTAPFTGADAATKLKLLGVDVAALGGALAATAGALEVTVNDPVARSYAKLVVSGDAKTLLGGVLVGDTSRYGMLNPLVGRPLPGDPVTMITPAGEAPALPGDAQVCSCYGLPKDALQTAIKHPPLPDLPPVNTPPRPRPASGPSGP